MKGLLYIFLLTYLALVSVYAGSWNGDVYYEDFSTMNDVMDIDNVDITNIDGNYFIIAMNENDNGRFRTTDIYRQDDTKSFNGMEVNIKYLQDINTDYTINIFSANDGSMLSSFAGRDTNINVLRIPVNADTTIDGIYVEFSIPYGIAIDSYNIYTGQTLNPSNKSMDMASSSSIISLPNPFIPSRDNEVSFACLIKGEVYITIQIYNVRGNLVRTVCEKSYQQASIYPSIVVPDAKWDGFDMYGNQVASGVYIVYIKKEYTDGNIEEDKNRIMVVF